MKTIYQVRNQQGSVLLATNSLNDAKACIAKGKRNTRQLWVLNNNQEYVVNASKKA